MKLLFFQVVSLAVVLSLLSASSVSLGLSCLNESGSPVDWFIMLKLPVNSSSSNIHEQTGNAYAYMDSSSSSSDFKVSQYGLDDNSNGALTYTVKQLFSSSGDINFIFYNDESPDSAEHQSNGHSKGVIGFDSNSGFWMVHSVPRFPPYSKDGYSYPSYATTYGQSFLCMNYELSDLNNIGAGIQYNDPYVFDSRISATMSNQVPNLVAVINGVHVKTASYNVTNLKTIKSKSFTQFAKTSAWNQDLYSALLQPYYGEDMYIETWMNGVGKMPSYCTPTYPFDSINVVLIDIGNGHYYTETKDHSKWAISTSSAGATVCIGDVNRQLSMANRGGGTVCTTDAAIWKAFNDLLVTVENCP